MKTSRIIQFITSAALFTVGSVFLLTGAAMIFTSLSFSLASLTLFRFSDLTRQVPKREVWLTVALLIVLAILIGPTNHFIPVATAEKFVRQPASVGGLWLIWMAALIWRWLRDSRSTNVKPIK